MSPTKLRTIYQKTNGRCAYCGVHLDPLGDWHIEHTTPKIQGGSSRMENLVASCIVCNGKKKGKSIDEYRVWLCQSAIERLVWLEKHLAWLKNHTVETKIEIALQDLERVRTMCERLEIKFYMDELEKKGIPSNR